MADVQLRRSGRTRKKIIEVIEPDYVESETENEVSDLDENMLSQEALEEEDHLVSPVSSSTRRSKRKSTSGAARSRNKKMVRDDDSDDEETVTTFKANASSTLGILYQAVHHPNTSLSPFIKAWTNMFRQSKNQALLDLANFLLQSCGVEFQLDVENIENDNRKELLLDIANQSSMAANNYPLVSKEKDMKTFHSRFLEFWGKLIHSVRGDILFDEDFHEFLTEWLTDVSCAARTSFRHTATEATVKVVFALIDVVLLQEEQKSIIEKQLNAEKKKKSKSAAKISQLESDLEDGDKKIEEINELISSLFEGVFVHRHRDKHAVVRSLCIVALAKWISAHPSFFLKDTFLKYIGWSLNDKDVSVRKASVDGIALLYEDEANHEKLEFFTMRFKARILEMTEDKDPKVAASAVKLVLKLLNMSMLEDDDGSNIPKLIWDEDRHLSRAAGMFTYHDTFIDPEGQKSSTLDDFIGDVDRIVRLYAGFCPSAIDEERGVKVFDSEFKESTEQFVDAMWTHLDVMKNWKVLVGVLLAEEDEGPDAEKYQSVETSDGILKVLAYIIRACAMKATGNLNENKAFGRIAPKVQEEIDRNTLSFCTFFMPRMSQILSVFEAQPEMLVPIVDIVQFMPVRYFTKRHKKDFEDIVKSLKSICLKHSDMLLLNQTVTSLQHLSMEEDDNPFSSNALSVVNQLSRELVDTFMSLDCRSQVDLSVEDSRALTACVSRIAALRKAIPHDDTGKNDDELYALLSLHISSPHGSGDIVNRVFNIAFVDLLHSLSLLDTATPDREEMEFICQQQQRLLDYVFRVFSYPKPHDALKPLYLGLCDLLLVFNERMNRTVFGRLVVRLSREQKETFRKVFFQMLQTGVLESQETAFQGACSAVKFNSKSLVDLGAEVLCYMGMYSETCDLHIKKMQAAIRDIDGELLLDLHLHTLKREFVEGSTSSVQELAQKLVMYHGMDSSKRSFKQFLAHGIDYALTDIPSRFDFLGSALLPFVSRSSLQDVAIIMKYLESVRKNTIDDDAEGDFTILNNFEYALSQKLKGEPAKMARTSPTKRSRITTTDLPEIFDEDISVINGSTVSGTPSRVSIGAKKKKKKTPKRASTGKRKSQTKKKTPPVKRKLKRRSRFA